MTGRRLAAALLASIAFTYTPQNRRPTKQRTAPPPTTSTDRVVAIGDVHGDLEALRSCLRLSGLVDREDAWVAAPGATLVSCGDVLDRGDGDWDCLTYLADLKTRATDAGGDVHLVLGNHEVLNVLGDVRFASRGALVRCACETDPGRSPGSRDDEWLVAARKRAFAPGSGEGARLLAALCGDAPVARVCGDTLFCHGGLHVVALTVGAARRKARGGDAPGPGAGSRALLDALNGDAARWLGGAGRLPPALSPSPSFARLERSYCIRRRGAVAAPLNQGINACCDDSVFRIDTGLSAYYGGPKEVLELRPGRRPAVLRSAPRGFL
ncbi:phosphoprotein phosphatase [Aureococcus anophagefferens]|uniref:Phosphoprotein phosphatase n=1 Tax=Aureococcus anophagefferens TaxID=44056 RepID=A0ABR1G379_AURAN